MTNIDGLLETLNRIKGQYDYATKEFRALSSMARLLKSTQGVSVDLEVACQDLEDRNKTKGE